MVAVIAALEFFWYLIFFFAWVIFLFFTMGLARAKGRSALGWGLLACFFPLITIIVLLILPAKTARTY